MKTYDKPDVSISTLWACDTNDLYYFQVRDDGDVRAVARADYYSDFIGSWHTPGGGGTCWLPITLPTFPPKPEPPEPLVIEAGRYYRTRDGRKAWIAARNPFPAYYPWIGSIEEPDRKTSAARSWTENGRFTGDEHESPFDIIAEWTEPNPRTKVPRLFTAKYEGKEVRGCYFPREAAFGHDHVFPDECGTLWCEPSQLTDIVYTTPEFEDEL